MRLYPTHEAYDPVRLAPGYSVFLSEILLTNTARQIFGPQSQDCSEVEARHSMLFPASLSAFVDLIYDVDLMSPKEKVTRTTARAVITMVAGIEAFRNWSVGEFPCGSLCRLSLLMGYGESSVAVVIGVPCEWPAWTKLRTMRRNWAILVDFAPEPLRQRLLGTSEVRTRQRTEGLGSALVVRELNPAMGTELGSKLAVHCEPPTRDVMGPAVDAARPSNFTRAEV